MSTSPFSLSEVRSLAEISRINVVGTSGSGKSTLSKEIAEVLAFPYVEMDKVFWKPNWEQPSDEEFFLKLENALAKEQWVLDGNYTRTIPIKWRKINLVVWVDYSFSRTLYQAVRRAFKRSWRKDELWEGTGNRESFRKSFFSKDSIIWWTITTYAKVKLKYEEMLVNPHFSHIKFVRLRSHGDAEEFLNSLRELQHRYCSKD
ncbi:adenylate kinase [Bdellovibrio sp. HCB-110]|uniref:adenylate kinase n=1 Tax=Bdellovibrio sp. HCB-110 TaxID=3391182 RepID=UPI0039B48905